MAKRLTRARDTETGLDSGRFSLFGYTYPGRWGRPRDTLLTHTQLHSHGEAHQENGANVKQLKVLSRGEGGKFVQFAGVRYQCSYAATDSGMRNPQN